MIGPETVMLAVQALMRVGSAVRDAYEQKVRDEAVALVDLDPPPLDEADVLWGFFIASPVRKARVDPGGDLAALWAISEGKRQPKDAESRRRLWDEVLRTLGEADEGASRVLEDRLHRAALVTVLAQWRPDAAPPQPWVRVAGALAEVVLDWLRTDPSLFGIDGRGATLVSAVAANAAELLPDPDKTADWKGLHESKFYFGARAAAIALHAGLETVAQQSGLVVGQAQYQALLKNVLAPLLDGYDDQETFTRAGIARLRDLLLGPMAEAALQMLHDNQAEFLGARFDPSNAVGAITAALFEAAAKQSLEETLTAEGALRLYRAALDVAATRPELFVSGDAPDKTAARELIGSLAEVLEKAPLPYRGATGAALGVAALEVLNNNAPRLLRPGDDAWRELGAEMLQSVLGGLAAGLGSGAVEPALANVLTKQQAVDLVVIFMRQAAGTPGMLVGKTARAELQGLVTAFATAVTSDAASLLDGKHWLEVAAAVATEAARNPARLFRLGKEPKDELLAKALAVVLNAAGEAFRSGGRSGAAVLFGETLRDAITLALRAAAGNADRARLHLDELAILLDRLNLLVASFPGRVGAREWLFLFERYVAAVLDTGDVTGITNERLLGALVIAEV
jgi:hypothetical protein